MRTLIILTLLLAACGSNRSTDDPVSPEIGQTALEAEATITPTAEPTPALLDDPGPTEEPTPALIDDPSPTEEPAQEEAAIGPPPAFSDQLRATDPQTVAIGQGRPQVIEFFAFW